MGLNLTVGQTLENTKGQRITYVGENKAVQTFTNNIPSGVKIEEVGTSGLFRIVGLTSIFVPIAEYFIDEEENDIDEALWAN